MAWKPKYWIQDVKILNPSCKVDHSELLLLCIFNNKRISLKWRQNRNARAHIFYSVHTSIAQQVFHIVIKATPSPSGGFLLTHEQSNTSRSSFHSLTYRPVAARHLVELLLNAQHFILGAHRWESHALLHKFGYKQRNRREKGQQILRHGQSAIRDGQLLGATRKIFPNALWWK